MLKISFCFLSPEYASLLEPCTDPEQHLERSLEAFQHAMDLTGDGHLTSERVGLLLKRYGNVYNELGVHKMNRAAALLSSENTDGDDAAGWFLSGFSQSLRNNS